MSLVSNKTPAHIASGPQPPLAANRPLLVEVEIGHRGDRGVLQLSVERGAARAPIDRGPAQKADRPLKPKGPGRASSRLDTRGDPRVYSCR
jgi:hypothetical protein